MKHLVLTLLGLTAVAADAFGGVAWEKGMLDGGKKKRRDESYFTGASAESAGSGLGGRPPWGPFFSVDCGNQGCKVCLNGDKCTFHPNSGIASQRIGGYKHSINCHHGGCEICSSVALARECRGYAPRPPGAGGEEHHHRQQQQQQQEAGPLGGSASSSGPAAAARPSEHMGIGNPFWFVATCEADGCELCVNYHPCTFYRARDYPLMKKKEQHQVKCTPDGCMACYHGMNQCTSGMLPPSYTKRPRHPSFALLPTLYKRSCSNRGCNVCVREECTFLPNNDGATYKLLGSISMTECNFEVCETCINGDCRTAWNRSPEENGPQGPRLPQSGLGCYFDKDGGYHCNPLLPRPSPHERPCIFDRTGHVTCPDGGHQQ